MKAFVAIARNLAIRDASPDDTPLMNRDGVMPLVPVAEIVIASVEPEYSLVPQKSAIEGGPSRVAVIKVPKTETFRFFVDRKGIEMMLETLGSVHAELDMLDHSYVEEQEKPSVIAAP